MKVNDILTESIIGEARLPQRRRSLAAAPKRDVSDKVRSLALAVVKKAKNYKQGLTYFLKRCENVESLSLDQDYCRRVFDNMWEMAEREAPDVPLKPKKPTGKAKFSLPPDDSEYDPNMTVKYEGRN